MNEPISKSVLETQEVNIDDLKKQRNGAILKTGACTLITLYEVCKVITDENFDKIDGGLLVVAVGFGVLNTLKAVAKNRQIKSLRTL